MTRAAWLELAALPSRDLAREIARLALARDLVADLAPHLATLPRRARNRLTHAIERDLYCTEAAGKRRRMRELSRLAELTEARHVEPSRGEPVPF